MPSMKNNQKELIFGTSENLSYEILEYVLNKKLKIHTSFEYKSFLKLAKIYRQKKYQNRIILKLKINNSKELEEKLRKFFFLFRTDNLFAIQLSASSIFSKNFENIYLAIQEYIKDKKIEKIYLENYWEYSKTNLQHIKKYSFNGLVIPYNLIEREIDNNLLEYLRSKKIEIISLRIFAGNFLDKSSKTFLNTLYIKYFFIILIIKLYSIFLKEKDLVKLHLDYFFCNPDLSCGIFFSSKIKNIENNINYKPYNLKNKKTLSLDNLLKRLIYKYNGLNSTSSIKHKMNIFYRIENFAIRSFLNFLKHFKTYFKLTFFLLLNRNICYLSSSSQYLNLTEFLKKKKF